MQLKEKAKCTCGVPLQPDWHLSRGHPGLPKTGLGAQGILTSGSLSSLISEGSEGMWFSSQ